MPHALLCYMLSAYIYVVAGSRLQMLLQRVLHILPGVTTTLSGATHTIRCMLYDVSAIP
jgi:hypothetical protein